MPVWDEIFSKPEFWAEYYRADFDAEDGDIFVEVFGVDPEMPSADWRAFDLYDSNGRVLRSRLEQLAKYGGDPAEAAQRMDRGFGAEWISGTERQLREALAQKDQPNEQQSLLLPFPDGTTWRIRFDWNVADVHSLEEEGVPPLILGWTGAQSCAPILRAIECSELCSALQKDWRGEFDAMWLPMLLHRTVGLTRSDAKDHREWLKAAWLRTKLVSAAKVDEWVKRQRLLERSPSGSSSLRTGGRTTSRTRTGIRTAVGPARKPDERSSRPASTASTSSGGGASGSAHDDRGIHGEVRLRARATSRIALFPSALPPSATTCHGAADSLSLFNNGRSVDAKKEGDAVLNSASSFSR